MGFEGTVSYDEFGIPIKSEAEEVAVDEFGIPIKKKEETEPPMVAVEPQEVPLEETMVAASPSQDGASVSTEPEPEIGVDEYGNEVSLAPGAEKTEYIPEELRHEAEPVPWGEYTETEEEVDDSEEAFFQALGVTGPTGAEGAAQEPLNEGAYGVSVTPTGAVASMDQPYYREQDKIKRASGS